MSDDKINIELGADPSGIEQGSRKAKDSVGSVTAANKELEKAFRALKAAIDPMFAAQEKFNKAEADAQALLKAKLISRKEFTAAMKLAQAALDEHTAALGRNSAAEKAAKAADKAARDKEAQDKRLANKQELEDRRLATQEKIALAQRERQAQQAAFQEMRAQIRELAREARDYATTARTAFSSSTAKSSTRGVTSSSNPTQLSVAQLEYQINRLTTAAEGQAKKATDFAASAAAAANAKMAESAVNASEKAAKAARDYADRAIEYRKQLLSLTLASAEQEAAAEKAAKDAASAAAKDASDKAAAAAKAAADARRAKTQADKEAKRAAEDLARAERLSAQQLQALRESISPAFAAQSRYNETMRMATQLLMQNKLTQGEWTSVQKQAQIQMDINARSLGRMNQVGVQLGYQMQDVTASIASGINPLVIFAQQSGQVAYAMQGMGGTAGKVAAVLGGVWFQAILAAVIIGEKLWSTHEQAKKKTLDLMDAESRRTATVKALTQALDEYVRKQHQANLETENAHKAQVEQARQIVEEEQKKLDVAQKKLNEMKNTPNVQSQGQGDLGRALAIQDQEDKVKALTKSRDLAAKALVEQQVDMAKAVSTMSQVELDHGQAVDRITSAYQNSKHSAADYMTMITQLRAEEVKYKKDKSDESHETQENTKAERELYKSREQAIIAAGRALQKQGYSISENKAFGGVTANHPGMGNAAHGANAIDINMPGVGNEASNAAAKKKMDDMVKVYQAAGFRILWNGKVYEPNGQGASYDIKPGSNQHTDHVHMEAPASIVGKPSGTQLAKGLIAEQTKELKDMETAAQKAARAVAAAVETKERESGADTTKTNEQKLAELQLYESQRIAILTQAFGAESQQVQAAEARRVEMVSRYEQRITAEKLRAIRRRQAMDQESAQASAELANVAAETQNAKVDFLLQNGLISERQAQSQRAQLMDQRYKQELSVEDALYAKKVSYLQEELAISGIEQAKRDELEDQLTLAIQAHLNTRLVMQANHAKQISELNNQAASRSMTAWRTMTSTFVSGLGSAFQSLWTKSATVQSTLLKLADNMVYKVVDLGLQAAEQQFLIWVGLAAKKKALNAADVAATGATEAAKTGVTASATNARGLLQTILGIKERSNMGATVAAHAAGEGVKTAASATAAAAQTGVAAAADTAEITAHAATSAAGAYKSTVVIPFIGPISAPAAAALALATVLGFGALISASGGQAEVPMDGQLSMLHKKEMVLPAWAAEPLRANLRAGNSSSLFSSTASAAGSIQNSSSESSTFSPTLNYQSAPGESPSQSARNARQIVKVLKDAHRNREFKDLR